MSVVSLRTSRGTYLGVATDSASLVCSAKTPAHFELVRREDGKSILRLAPGRELELRPLDDDSVAIVAAGGETTGIGDHERFRIEVVADVDLTAITHGCCGSRPREEAGVLWEEGAHRRLLEKATEMLVALRQQLPEVQLFLDRYWQNATFRGAAFRGLREADDRSPWSDNNWSSHFYNPENGTNYAGSKEKTALSEGRRYFGLSQHVGQRIYRFTQDGVPPGDILYKHAGYFLGLSLHFLTDLTQPMHAANFTNAYGWEGTLLPNFYDRRHAGFEVLSDDVILLQKLVDDLPPLTSTDVAPFTDPGSYLHEVAGRSKSVFGQDLRAILIKKESETFHGIPLPLYRENFWRTSEAMPALRSSLRLAPLRVAQYLVNWARRVQVDLNLTSDKWYSILEPTKAPSNPNDLDKFEVADMTQSTGAVQRWQWKNSDNQKWFLHFNADGTMCIGSRQWKHSLWLIWPQGEHWWIGHGNSVDLRNTRFRAIPHDNRSVWIFEPTRNEAVRVKTSGDYQGHFYRSDPFDPPSQLFRFRELGPISDAERAEIRKNFPDFGKRKWWGTAGSVPEWDLPDR